MSYRITLTRFLFLLLAVAGFAFEAAALDAPKEGHSPIEGNLVDENSYNVVTVSDARFVTVSGIVRDAENSEPLIGVNVIVQNSGVGTVTDIDGYYSLEVPEGDAVLVFSYTGYKPQEITVGNQTNLDVVLEPATALLDEVVVVGYGTKKKINVTGAVDNVNMAEDIGERPVSNLPQMLQGMMPNLNISTNSSGGEPGATNNINIRGVGTLTGSGGTPYILLDGLPITEAQMNAINPYDVESVSILKDAASAAIYGSRGAYGVILITTKNGTKGQGVQVDFSSNLGMAGPTNLPEFMNSLDAAAAMNQARANEGAVPMFTDEEIQDMVDYQNGLKSSDTEPNDVGTNWRYWEDGYANYDWMDEMYADWAPRQQYRLSLHGGSDKTTFFLSGNFYDQKGNLEYGKDEYDRINVTANVANQVNNWLAFDVSAKYARENRVFPSGGFGSYDKNIIYHQVSRLWPMVPKTGPDGQIVNADIARIENSGNTTELIDNTILQIGTDIEPIKGWVTRVSYNWNLTNGSSERIRLINPIPLPDGTTNNVGYNPDQVARGMDNITNQLINVTSTYNTTINRHNFGGLIGFEQRLQQETSLWGSRSQFITPSLPTLSTAVGEQLVDDGLNQFSTRGVFGRLSYNYADKYLIEFNARYDGSSFFTEGKRWGFFPSVSVGYNLAQEGYWGNLGETVNVFKLRASWGQLGNHDPALAGLYQELMPAGNSSWLLNGSRPTIILPPNLVSPGLTWETVTTLDFGFDAALWQDRLEVSFDWYNRVTSDMIGPAEALPELLGTAAPRENNAELNTKGWELALRWRGNFGNVGYRIGGNLSDNLTTVDLYNNPTNILSTFREGQNLGEIWGYESVGYFESDQAAADAPDQSYFFSRWTEGDMQYLDSNGDGVVNVGDNTFDNPGDRSIIGNNTPRYAYGVNLGVNWKGFDLAILVQGVGKRDYFFDGSTNLFWGFRGNQWQNSYTVPNMDYWTPDNRDAYYPKPYLNTEHSKNTQIQTKYLQDASYVRLKNVQLTYTFPANLVDGIGLRNLQVYFSGENLVTMTKLQENFDPEVLGGAWGAGKIYPLQRVLSFGLNVGI